MARSQTVSNDEVRAFGSRVYERRIQIGMSQNEVARRLGLDDYSGLISRIESGQREPGVILAAKLARILRISLRTLTQDADRLDYSD